MSDKYALTPNRRRAVALLAGVFLFLGLQRTVTLATPLVAPSYMMIVWRFENGHHRIAGEPLELLPDEPRAEVARNAGARGRYLARLDRPEVRLQLFLLELIGRLPELAVMYSLGIALWRASRPAPDAALTGLPWLVRAGWASLAMAIVPLVANAAEATMLLQGVIPLPDSLLFDFDLETVQDNLLLAAGALAAAWTIAAGLKARADLAEIV